MHRKSGKLYTKKLTVIASGKRLRGTHKKEKKLLFTKFLSYTHILPILNIK